jgi:hypothetical protein
MGRAGAGVVDWRSIQNRGRTDGDRRRRRCDLSETRRQEHETNDYVFEVHNVFSLPLA